MITSNQKVINEMKKLIRENVSMNDFQRYLQDFYREKDFNLYQYGNLDIYDYDLYKRLKDFGVTIKAVKEYEKVLDYGCTYKHRENIRNTYMKLVNRAARQLRSDIRWGLITEKDFMQ